MLAQAWGKIASRAPSTQGPAELRGAIWSVASLFLAARRQGKVFSPSFPCNLCNSPRP
uniref:ANL04 n=1 Tax=Synechococcus elongatus (strain ATCC 33912 / PCC 7942 / FACHB-805) TaxID=1140 RepID=Q8KUW9_SYNE7|nr:ANL04 [Synechococcus elongatus PCC 7942 = FACHB-805]